MTRLEARPEPSSIVWGCGGEVMVKFAFGLGSFVLGLWFWQRALGAQKASRHLFFFGE
jgi:hypothetical protein